MSQGGENIDLEGALRSIALAIAQEAERLSRLDASTREKVTRLQFICDEDVERLRKRCDEEVGRIQAELAREKALLSDLRRQQARILDMLGGKLAAQAQSVRQPLLLPQLDGFTSAMGYASSGGAAGGPQHAEHRGAGDRPPEHPDGAPEQAMHLRRPANKAKGIDARDDQAAYDQLVAEVASLDAKPRSFPRLKTEPSGRSPRGFAAAVRAVAHRAIARAGRPLDRDAILAEVRGVGIPLPEKGTNQKVSKVLSKDFDLKNKRGRGYSLTFAALRREASDILAEQGTGGSAATPRASKPQAAAQVADIS